MSQQTHIPKDSPVKVHVGTLSYRHVSPSAHGSAMRLAFSIAPLVTAFSFKEDTYLPQARCDIADAAIETWKAGQATHLLWLDDDLVFYEEGYPTALKDGRVVQLNLAARLACHGLPVVSGVYYLHNDARPVAMMLAQDGSMSASFIGRVPKANTLMNVDVVGFGCLLMDIKVLSDMRDKYGDDLFQMPPVSFTDRQTGERKNRSIGEDVFFCHRLKEMGVPVHLDCGVHLGHVKTEITNRDGHVIVWGEGDGPVDERAPIDRIDATSSVAA